MLFYDSETKYTLVGNEQHHTLDFGWINSCRYEKGKGFIKSKYHLIDNQRAFCEKVIQYTREKTVLYMFAHNIFFDLQVSGFFKYMTEYGWTRDFYYDQGLTYILALRKGKRCIKCISTTNYFDCSLKLLGEIVGREKTEIDFKESSRDEKIEYCYNDVMIIRESMEKYFNFILDHDLGMFAMTKSSQAFNAYRHRFMVQGIFIHEEEPVIELERLAYHGGRCECYHIGKLDQSQYVCLDINSMYPYIMKSRKLPSMLISYGDTLTLKEVGTLLENYAVIAEVEIQTDSPVYAIRYNGKLTFPIGKFEAYLCTEGLKTALKNNHIIKINRYAVYEQSYLFTDYVDYFYSLRQQYKNEGNKIYEQLCKYFMNTLYGKFGQKRTLTEIDEDITFDGYWREAHLNVDTMQWRIFTKFLNKLSVTYGEENAKNTIVAIPAHITEYGRLMLYETIKRAGLDKVLYSDTDSIIIKKENIKGMENRIDDKQLGKLKIEYTTESLTIHGCKDYETDHDVKIKGVPKSSFQMLNDVYVYNQFLGQASHLTKKVNDSFIVQPIVKTNKRIYDKGVVLPSGKVEPISLVDVC